MPALGVATIVPLTAGSTSTVDFKGQFNAFWSAISSASNFSGILSVMSIIGAALVGIAVLKWVWEKRRGGLNGGNHQGVMGALIVGCVLSAPAFLIPAILGVLDVVVNGLIHVWQNSSGGLGS